MRIDAAATQRVFGGLCHQLKRIARCVIKGPLKKRPCPPSEASPFGGNLGQSGHVSASGLPSDLEDDLETSIDAINLVNDTEEMARVAYFQDLAANAVAGLSILSLQRSSIVTLIQQIAGLT